MKSFNGNIDEVQASHKTVSNIKFLTIKPQPATPKLSVRELRKNDIPLIIDYWLTATPAFLQGMGVNLNKMLNRQQWLNMLQEQLSLTYEQKKSYFIIWLLDDKPVGHSNVNRITFGEEGYMHLHIWYSPVRSMGFGISFIKMTLAYYFNNLQLKRIFCEPYALNPSPNKVLAKAGFELIKEYTTTPGMLNFEQPVTHWQITRENSEL